MVMFTLRNMIVAAALIFVGYKLASFRGLPNVVVVLAILTVLYAFFTESTTPGRRIYALGGNEKAAKLSGINTEKLVFLTFVNMGVLGALAGLVGSLLVGLTFTKALCASRGLPLIGVNHLEGHIHAVLLEAGVRYQTAVGLRVAPASLNGVPGLRFIKAASCVRATDRSRCSSCSRTAASAPALRIRA